MNTLRYISTTRVNTAGAYVSIHGLYPFALGWQPKEGRIPVIRLGGHRQEGESGWQCAAREVYEEARLRLTPLIPPATYWTDADRIERELTPIHWEHEAEREHTPLLVVSACHEGQSGLSLMFLAEADELPTPSSEIHGLLLLDRENIQRLCQQPLTLGEYLRRGGQAVLNGEFDENLVLEPFIQLHLLARILGVS